MAALATAISRPLCAGRARVGDALEPAAHPVDPAPPGSGDLLQVLGSLRRGDQTEVPGVLGGPLEPDIVEPCREPEEHERWRGDAQAVIPYDDVLVVDPRAERPLQPVR